VLSRELPEDASGAFVFNQELLKYRFHFLDPPLVNFVDGRTSITKLWASIRNAQYITYESFHKEKIAL
jgi:hypothetical protein